VPHADRRNTRLGYRKLLDLKVFGPLGRIAALWVFLVSVNRIRPQLFNVAGNPSLHTKRARLSRCLAVESVNIYFRQVNRTNQRFCGHKKLGRTIAALQQFWNVLVDVRLQGNACSAEPEKGDKTMVCVGFIWQCVQHRLRYSHCSGRFHHIYCSPRNLRRIDILPVGC